jgi:hypothetical protein
MWMNFGSPKFRDRLFFFRGNSGPKFHLINNVPHAVSHALNHDTDIELGNDPSGLGVQSGVTHFPNKQNG